MRGLWLALVMIVAAQPALAGVVTRQIQVGGVAREYLLYVPKNAAKPMPVVFALHGGGGTPSSMRGVGFEPLADKYGFAVVYPKGVDKQWADGRKDLAVAKAHPEVDDVAFLTGVMDAMVAEGADARRIYFTGISNGAIMSYRMACDRAESIAAIAPVAGSLPVGLDCKPGASVPVLAINGTKDGWVLYNGGPVAKDGNKHGYTQPVADTVSFWEQRDGCTGDEKATPWPKLDEKDATQVIALQKEGCAVELLSIEGGGHTWPGRKMLWETLLSFTVGPLSMQMDATQVIWGFFADKRR